MRSAAERAFLAELGEGCDVPGGAHATSTSSSLTLHGVLLSEDGSTVVRGVETGAVPCDVGRILASRLRAELRIATASP